MKNPTVKHAPGGIVVGLKGGKIWLSVDGRGMWLSTAEGRMIAQSILASADQAEEPGENRGTH